MPDCHICGRSCKNLQGLSGHVQMRHPGMAKETQALPERVERKAQSADWDVINSAAQTWIFTFLQR